MYGATLDLRMHAAADLIEAIRSGLVTASSFGFTVAQDRWNDDYTGRSIIRVERLFDVSPVSWASQPGDLSQAR